MTENTLKQSKKKKKKVINPTDLILNHSRKSSFCFQVSRASTCKEFSFVLRSRVGSQADRRADFVLFFLEKSRKVTNESHGEKWNRRFQAVASK